MHHARNVGSIFRPENPLLPNYKYVPIAYHGRASSIVLSGTPIRRPMGQTRENPSAPAHFAPSRRLDYEAELGFLVGPGNPLGARIPIEEAEQHIFGFCIVNDWSARDIQAWEYQPLGPFLAKNFATTLSPWLVTIEALAPFRVPRSARPEGDPDPLPYLASENDTKFGGIDINLEVLLSTAQMRLERCAPVRLSHGKMRDLYWTPAQMLTHHASNGCNLRPGDLIATGTISGEAADSRGCLLEMTRGGAQPVMLPSGEKRVYLEDGDEVIMRAFCESPRATRIGWGECRGTVLPALPAEGGVNSSS
jgi:fumarylacetoacetase